jgi:hypothetical protein
VPQGLLTLWARAGMCVYAYMYVCVAADQSVGGGEEGGSLC